MDENQEFEDVKPDPDAESFPCSFPGCGKTFASLAVLCTHEAVCGKAGDTPRRTCHICGSQTAARSLKRHMKQHEPPEFACPVCGKQFIFRYNLKVHVKTHTKECDPLEGGSLNINELVQALEIPIRRPKSEPESFECPICGIVVKFKTKFRYHMNEHEGITPFACKQEGCDQVFASPALRIGHERTVHSESVQCRLCDKMLANPGSLQKHMAYYHKVPLKKNLVLDEQKLPCPICSARFRKKSLEHHMNQHRGIKPYPCRNEGCRNKFSWPAHRSDHERECRATASKCPLCGVELANGWARQEHMAAFHKDESVMLELEPEEPKVTFERKRDADGRFECPECPKVFNKFSSLRYHVNAHNDTKPYVCVRCAKGFYSRQAHAYHEKKCLAGIKIRKSAVKKEPKPTKPVEPPPKPPTPPLVIERQRAKKSPKVRTSITCHLCNSVLASQKMFDRHMRVHNGAGLYSCKEPGCGETFATVRLKNQHAAEQHGAELPEEPKKKEKAPKSWMCEICSTVCTHRKNFREHMNTHYGIKQMMCRNAGCTETFSRAFARHDHEQVCRGEVAICPVCEKPMKTRNILRIHMRRFHPDQVPPPQVRTKSTVVKTYPCTLCSRVFQNARSIDYHMNVHNGERPFQCRNEGCTEGFASRSLRLYHEGGCGTGPLPCTVEGCGMVLKNKKTLRNHLRFTHSGGPVSKHGRKLRRQVEEQEDGIDVSLVKFEADEALEVEWLDDEIEEDDDEPESLSVIKEEVVEEDEDFNVEIEIKQEKVEADDEQSLDDKMRDDVSIKDEPESEIDEQDNPLYQPDANFQVKSDLGYHCHLCPKILREARTLRNHLNSHTGVRPYKCRENGCKRAFPNPGARSNHESRCRGETFSCSHEGCKFGPTTKQMYQRHMNRFHRKKDDGDEDEKETQEAKDKQKFVCKLCSTVYSTAKMLEYHMNRHQGLKPYPCINSACGESFASPIDRRTHNCEAQPMRCPFCPVVLKNQQSRFYHIRTRHSEERRKANEQKITGEELFEFAEKEGLVAPEPVKEPPVRKFVCEICGSSYAMEKTLRLHKAEHSDETPYECRKEGCTEKFRKPTLRSYHEMNCGTTEKFDCPFCDAKMKNKPGLASHIKRLHKEGPRRSSTQQGPFMCDICSMEFDLRTPFERHMKEHETAALPEQQPGGDPVDIGDGWVKCVECGKILRKRMAEFHMNSHRGVRPFVCEICQQGFFSDQALRGHVKKCRIGKKMRKSPRAYISNVANGGPKEEPIYQCDICSEICSSRHNLYNHRLKHKGRFECTFEGCSSSFCRKYMLTNHLKDSHGVEVDNTPKVEKTLKCKYCPQMFGYRCSLKRHLQLHEASATTTMTLLVCPQCDGTFATEEKLNKHLESCIVELALVEEY